jgi:hypothetical protein
MPQQINPEYLAKIVEYTSRINTFRSYPDISTEQSNIVDDLEESLERFIVKVKVWEGLSETDTIDLETGFVTGE